MYQEDGMVPYMWAFLSNFLWFFQHLFKLSPSVEKENHISYYKLANAFSNFIIFVGFRFALVLEASHSVRSTFFILFGTHLGILLTFVLILVCYYVIWMNLEDKIKENKHLQFLYTFEPSHLSSPVDMTKIIMVYFNFHNHRGAMMIIMILHFYDRGSWSMWL